MQEREPTIAVAHPPLGTSGWASWAPELGEPAAPHGPAAWISVGVSLALWACTTVLALQYL
jgi:hypothetical protein